MLLVLVAGNDLLRAVKDFYLRTESAETFIFNVEITVPSNPEIKDFPAKASICQVSTKTQIWFVCQAFNCSGLFDSIQ